MRDSTADEGLRVPRKSCNHSAFRPKGAQSPLLSTKAIT